VIGALDYRKSPYQNGIKGELRIFASSLALIRVRIAFYMPIGLEFP
jgi:hypothetical protein